MQIIARHALIGLGIGSGLGLLVCLACTLRPSERVDGWVGLTALAGLTAGLVVGLLRRPSLEAIAALIDRRAGLKDRVSSALQFSATSPQDAYRILLGRDAARALEAQAIPQLLPWHWPSEGFWAAAAIVLAVGALLFVPRPQEAHAVQAGPPQAVVVEAYELKEDLEQFEQLAEDLGSDEMRELTRQLREILAGVEQEARTADEAMLQLAKMTAAVEAAAAPYDTLLLQQMMRDLGEGLSPLAGFEAAAEQLKQGGYDQAAQTLQNFGRQIGSGERPMLQAGGLLDSGLGQLAQQAQGSGLQGLSQAIEQLRSAIRSGTRGECEGALRKLGGVIGQYGQRAKIGSALRAQLDSLSQHRQNLSCRGGFCNACRNGGQCEGGQCKGTSLARNSNISRSPSQGAGRGAALSPFDRPTEMRGHRTLENITGQLGEGQSDTEIEIQTEGLQAAARQYREVYAKYRKISEAAMAEEAVPLGHRQTIKRYFELIHPDRVEADGLLRDVPQPAVPAPAGQEDQAP